MVVFQVNDLRQNGLGRVWNSWLWNTLLWSACLLVATLSTAQSMAAPGIDFYSASETSIDTVRGVRLSWRVREAARVDVLDGYRNTLIPDLGNEGFIEVWPERTSTYTLVATGAGNQSVRQSITIYVAPPQILQFLASAQVIYNPQLVRLNWVVRGAQRVEILDMTKNQTFPNLGREGNFEVYVERTTVFRISVFGMDNAMISQQLTVNASIIPAVDFFAPATTVVQANQPVDLRWQVRNAKRVDLHGGDPFINIENLPLISVFAVWPQRTSRYYLRVIGMDDQVLQYQTWVQVVPGP